MFSPRSQRGGDFISVNEISKSTISLEQLASSFGTQISDIVTIHSADYSTLITQNAIDEYNATINKVTAGNVYDQTDILNATSSLFILTQIQKQLEYRTAEMKSETASTLLSQVTDYYLSSVLAYDESKEQYSTISSILSLADYLLKSVWKFV